MVMLEMPMLKIVKQLLPWLTIILFLSPAAAKEPPHVRASLISAVASVAPGDNFDVLLHQDIDKGWHTYWKNPGDSGAAPTIKWQSPEGVDISDFSWPFPERIAYGPLMNYGYHDEVSLPFTVSVPEGFKESSLTIEGVGRILVCEDICIPEKISVALTIPIGETVEDAGVAAQFRENAQRIPTMLSVAADFRADDESINLHIALPVEAGNRVSAVQYFPFQTDVIDNPAEQAYRIDSTGLTLTLVPGYKFEAATADLSGVLVIRESSGSSELITSFSFLTGGNSGNPSLDAAAPVSFWLAIILAFAGGLILNLMPCVFPVLSIKILSLVDSVHEAGSSIRLHGFVYAAGVILSFVGIAFALILLRLGGESIGWGFQLQSPLIVGLLAYLFVLIGLNLLGVFEIGLSVMSLAGGTAGKGYTGSFATGVLATLVAAPCTAPFMGAAVGFALTQSMPVALTVFAALGAGMAAPYVLLCYSPGLLSRLPSPGNWMLVLKQMMAFPMFGSAIWLLWVLGIQTDVTGMMQVLTGGLLLGFAAWLTSQFRKGSRAGLIANFAGLVMTLAAGYLVLIQNTSAPHHSAVELSGETSGVYSASALKTARQQGPVLVNFTAAWCITCKVNELNALSTDAVKSVLKDKGITYLKGDWTNEDPAITEALQAYGRSGVPLYLLYRQGSERAEVLPQILTEGIVLRALDTL